MGVTGITENKLFKVRTLDPDNLYQVGVNGVTNVIGSSVVYEIDDIKYTTYLSNQITDSTVDFPKIKYRDKGRKSYTKLNKSDTYSRANIGQIGAELVPGTRNDFKYTTTVGNGINVSRTVKPKTSVPELPSGGDTIYVTKGFSYDQFITTNIVKKEEYVGLISHPIVESDLFIERDEYTIFERHQRLSEINNLATLQNYRGGYFKNIKTL